MFFDENSDDYDIEFENEVQKQKYKELIKKLKQFYTNSYINEKSEYEETMKYRIEYVDCFTPVDEVNNIIRRNMDKFDMLTSKGYKLNFLTGEFKLPA